MPIYTDFINDKSLFSSNVYVSQTLELSQLISYHFRGKLY